MQKLKIIKTNDLEYHRAENEINDMIVRGSKIESLTPIATKTHHKNTSFNAIEIEILIFVLYTEG